MMSAADCNAITIVSGLPRSGTSLLMQMLAAGGMPVLSDGVRAADLDNPRGYYEFEPVKRTRQDPSWLDTARGRVVKMVHLLLYDLPPTYSYRIVLMRRKLREVLASQRAMLQRQGKQGANLPDAQLAQVFQGQLERLERWLQEQPHFALLQVDYNQLVADPAAVVPAIAHFLGGTLDPAAMIGAVDLALYRQRG